MLAKYPIISDQVDRDELAVILETLENLLRVGMVGSVVEFGCYEGTTSLFIRRLLDKYQSSAQFHVYDSFAGLPEKRVEDLSPAGEQFKTGELMTSKKTFITNFKKANLAMPRIHKAWFNDLTPDDVPDQICFAFLDGDYYQSINDSLKLIWPKLTTGAVIVVDDYVSDALPGAARAVDEWLKGQPAKVRLQVRSSLAVINTT